MKLLTICVVLLATFTELHAIEKILVPVVTHPVGVSGAFGSRWVTELTGYNPSSHVVAVASSPCGLPCVGLSHQPQTAFTVRLAIVASGAGSFLYVGEPQTPLEAARSLRFNLRIQDVSRQGLTWGTELPVIREDDLFMSEIELLNVPTDERFRQTLRIYDFDSDQSQVGVRIYTMNDSTTPIVDTSVTLAKPHLTRNSEEAVGQATIDLIAAYPFLPRNDRLRVQIRPITPGLRFWGFISVTNNETQHVTTITPD